MNITDGLLGQLKGKPLGQISQQLGISPGQASTAIAAALPLLIGALGRNSRQAQGAEELFGALQRDHSGRSSSDVLNTALGSYGDGQGDGEKILGHIFGARKTMAEQGLGVATGLQPDMANKVLRLLAPVALGYIAKKMFDRRQAKAAANAPATTAPASPTDLSDVLGHEEVQITKQEGVGGKLLGAVLDRNHDGKVDFTDLMAGLNGGRA